VWIETVVHAREGSGAAVHRLAVAGDVEPRPEPLPVRRQHAVDPGAHEAGRRLRDQRLAEAPPLRDDRPQAGLRRLFPQRPKHRLHVVAKEEVEIGTRLRGEVLAVPPEPVGGLGAQKEGTRRLHGLAVASPRGAIDRCLRLAHEIPGTDVLYVPDPDAEVRLDPRTGMDPPEPPDG